MIRTSSLSFLLLSLMVVHNCRASNSKAPTKIIFGDDSSRNARIRGEVVGNIPKHLELYAFLIAAHSQPSKEIKALIAPNYQSPVRQGQFSFAFVQSGQYLVGIFIDRIQNSLLDLYDDPYWFADNMPVRLSSNEVYDFKVNIEETNWPEIHLKNFPTSHSLLFQIGAADGSPFFLIPIENNPFEVKGITKPFGFSVILDRNENEKVDPSERTKQSYWIPSTPQSSYTVEYGKIWNPLQLYFKNGPLKPALSIQKISKDGPTGSIVLPKSTSADDNNLISLPHLESGEYQMLIHPNKNEVIKGPTYTQERDNRWEIDLSDKYKAEFQFNKNSIPENSYLLFLIDGNPVYTSKFNQRVNLYQKGQYEVALYSNWKDIKNLESNKLNYRILDVRSFVLTEATPSVNLDFRNKKNKVRISGNYHWMHEPPSNVHLNFFQKSDLSGYWNCIFKHITTESESRILSLTMEIDPNKDLYVHIDLNQNDVPDDSELKFSQLISSNQLRQKENKFQFPTVMEGELTLEVSGPNPDNYFLEIFQNESNEALLSSFLAKNVNTFNNLPLGYKLKLNIIHDVNANKELDSEDIILPPKFVSIDFLKKNLKLAINLEDL